MSWLFGRRSGNEDDSDEYTDASYSEDEYTDASDSEEDYTDDDDGEKQGKGETPPDPKAEEALSLEVADAMPIQNGVPPPTNDANTNDKSNDQGTEMTSPNATSEHPKVDQDEIKEVTAVENGEPVVTEILEHQEAAPGADSNMTPPVPEKNNTNTAAADRKQSTPAMPAPIVETINREDESSSEEEDYVHVTKKPLVESPKEESPKLESSDNDAPAPVNEGEKRGDVGGSTAASKPVDSAAATKEQDTSVVMSEEDHTGEEEEPEEVTSMHEKRSLLVLAAEHDRVDILKAILADGSEDRDNLMNSNIPPLHISIAYGSSNAVQSLLRMGADPSIRPDVAKIKSDAEEEGEEKLVDIPNMGRFDGLSAWELAFGKSDDDKAAKPQKSGWFGGSKKTIYIAPSKLEGIRHAFTAEALRCIGSDEVVRMKQLLTSGMPPTIDIGGKNLYDWSVEMSAVGCEVLLRPAEENSADDGPIGDTISDQQQQQERPNRAQAGSTAVLDRSKPGTESLSQLTNRIDELDSLSKALSSCLDNLAEEVSVCHGLLLMGGGASALASHVRSLKNLKENKTDELDRLEEAWENSEDELAYWVKESGAQGKEIAELMSPAMISTIEFDQKVFEGTPEEEEAHKQQLKAQTALLENKLRKLRASITDLSEENTRDLEEVENRGLSGGIKLVRGLRDEIREIEFTLNETKSAEALCRAKIKLFQAKVGSKKRSSGSHSGVGGAVGASGSKVNTQATDLQNGTNIISESNTNGDVQTQAKNHSGSAAVLVGNTKPSEAIATGKSTAIALQNPHTKGYLTVNLWRILLRIIGLGSSSSGSRPLSTPLNSGSKNVMTL